MMRQMHRRLPPLAAITLNASTSVETSLFNIDHIQRTINSYAVNLEYRLRNIKTNRANLAHGRLPHVVCFDATTLWHFDAAEWAPFHSVNNRHHTHSGVADDATSRSHRVHLLELA
jgi:hypothetical protein